MVPEHLSLFSQTLLRIYGLAQSETVERFQDAALGVIQEIVPFSSSMWGSATMTDAGIDIHTLHLHNTSMRMIEEYETVKHLDQFAQEVVSKSTHTIRFSAAAAQSPEYRAFLVKHGHHHGLITQSIHEQTRFVQWLSLYRNDPQSECSQEEVLLLSTLFPHLMQALTINRKVHVEQLLGSDCRARWSVAIADQYGFLYYADPDFLKILRQDHAVNDDERLPETVVTAILQSVTELKGSHSVISCSREKDLLFLKTRNKVLADELNQREYIIAKMLASGLSLKDIANKLNRSPDTIRSHGKSIYKKLGTNKVTQLSTLLLQRD